MSIVVTELGYEFLGRSVPGGNLQDEIGEGEAERPQVDAARQAGGEWPDGRGDERHHQQHHLRGVGRRTGWAADRGLENGARRG